MITPQELQELALLAKLELPEGETEALAGQLAQIIAFADTINSYGAQAAGFENIGGLQNVLREDVVLPSTPQEEILQNVGGGEEGCFPVRQRG